MLLDVARFEDADGWLESARGIGSDDLEAGARAQGVEIRDP